MACGTGEHPTLAEHLAQPVLATGMWKGFKYEARANPGSCRFCDLRSPVGRTLRRRPSIRSCAGWPVVHRLSDVEVDVRHRCLDALRRLRPEPSLTERNYEQTGCTETAGHPFRRHAPSATQAARHAGRNAEAPSMVLVEAAASRVSELRTPGVRIRVAHAHASHGKTARGALPRRIGEAEGLLSTLHAQSEGSEAGFSRIRKPSIHETAPVRTRKGGQTAGTCPRRTQTAQKRPRRIQSAGGTPSDSSAETA